MPRGRPRGARFAEECQGSTESASSSINRTCTPADSLDRSRSSCPTAAAGGLGPRLGQRGGTLPPAYYALPSAGIIRIETQREPVQRREAIAADGLLLARDERAPGVASAGAVQRVVGLWTEGAARHRCRDSPIIDLQVGSGVPEIPVVADNDVAARSRSEIGTGNEPGNDARCPFISDRAVGRKVAVLDNIPSAAPHQQPVEVGRLQIHIVERVGARGLQVDAEVVRVADNDSADGVALGVEELQTRVSILIEQVVMDSIPACVDKLDPAFGLTR